eukprot:929619-Rhodomonas_salina.2
MSQRNMSCTKLQSEKSAALSEQDRNSETEALFTPPKFSTFLKKFTTYMPKETSATSTPALPSGPSAPAGRAVILNTGNAANNVRCSNGSL